MDDTENVTQSSFVTGEIAKDIVEVNQDTSEISNSSSQVNMGATELSNLAEQLNEMIGRSNKKVKPLFRPQQPVQA